MEPATFTSRDFNREPNRIKRAARHGPVIITERSRPDLVVLSYERYAQLAGAGAAGTGGTFLDRISFAGLSDINLDTDLPKDAPRDAGLG